MFTDKNFKTLYATLGVISWLLLVMLVLSEQFFILGHYNLEVPLFAKALFFSLFIINIYLFSGKKIELQEGIDFYNILWSVFYIGTLCTIMSVVLTIVMKEIGGQTDVLTASEALLRDFLYHVELALMIFFLVTVFINWKKLVLYKASSFTRNAWQSFEYLLLFTLLLHFFSPRYFEGIFPVALGFFLLLSVVISINLSWIAFLNLRQKASAILLLIAIMACLFYFYQVLSQYTDLHPIDIHLSESIFLSSLFMYAFIYSTFSVLVLFFNLPTSSVFEKKFSELSSFQRLSESILEGRTERQVYDVLIESAISIVKSDAAWLEVEQLEEIVPVHIEREDARLIKVAIAATGYNHRTSRKFSRKQIDLPEDRVPFDSILVVPLISHDKHLGTLVLLKTATNAFDNVMTNLINMYAAQASIALDNFRLIAEAVENERFKSEMMTAKKVKHRLLPKLSQTDESMELLACCYSPDQIGGDYFDYFKLSDHKYALIIADVSGKGTSAAFNMAQMKGIFHSLVQLDLSPDMFMMFANAALCRCLEKNSFITATYFVIDTEVNKVYYARAGHCPTLYFNAQTSSARFFESKGLGLGILRNEKYANFVEVNFFEYNSGDMMLLYTDGIVEAKPEDKEEEYGYERLRSFIESNHTQPLPEVGDALLSDVYAFAGSAYLQDDYTLLLVRFR